MVAKSFEADLLKDSPIYEKYHNIPAVYYSSWLERFDGSFSGKDVLDFGCGDGIASAGIAEFCEAKSVLGVDINRNFENCDPILKEITGEELSLPKVVNFKQVKPAEYIGDECFDVVVSWSVFEHISQDIFDEQMKVIVQSIKLGGFAVFQIAPLYYAPFGSHLFGLHKPWEHLTMQLSILWETVCRDHNLLNGSAESVWSLFATLNKFTDVQIRNKLRSAGLDVLHTYESFTSEVPSDYLLSIFSRDLLTKEQILLVCRKMP